MKKRSLQLFLILAVFFSSTPTIFAIANTGGSASTPTTQPPPSQGGLGHGGSVTVSPDTPGLTSPGLGHGRSVPDPNAPPDVGATEAMGLQCGILGQSRLADCIPLVGYYLFYVPASWVLTLSGLLFDAFMAFSLSGKIMSSDFVLITWRIILNLTDILFIFLLLYIAVRTILGLGDWKNEAANVIVIALLVNFSLFFTQIVIDASNITALAFYNRISTQGATLPFTNNTPLLNPDIIGFKARSISGYFVDSVQPQKLSGIINAHDWAKGYKVNPGSGEEPAGVGGLFFVFLATAVVAGFLAYALFEASFLMLGRVISFWFLMIFSPLAFIGYALPAAKKITGPWIERVTNQALIAPVFLMFLYIIAFMVKSKAFSMTAGGTNENITSLLLIMALKTSVLVGVLLLAVKVTKSLSDEFGNQVRGALVKTAQTKGALALGATGFLGRNTVGRSMNAYLQKKDSTGTTREQRMQNAAANSRFARLGLNLSRKTASGSYDARNIRGANKVFEKMGVKDTWKGAEGEGFRGAQEKNAEKQEKVLKSLLSGITDIKERADIERRFAEHTAKGGGSLWMSATRAHNKVAGERMQGVLQAKEDKDALEKDDMFGVRGVKKQFGEQIRREKENREDMQREIANANTQLAEDIKNLGSADPNTTHQSAIVEDLTKQRRAITASIEDLETQLAEKLTSIDKVVKKQNEIIEAGITRKKE
ncbi:MAG: coiled-coil domain-containing protein [Minisyncoccota bacterium]